MIKQHAIALCALCLSYLLVSILLGGNSHRPALASGRQATLPSRTGKMAAVDNFDRSAQAGIHSTRPLWTSVDNLTSRCAAAVGEAA